MLLFLIGVLKMCQNKGAMFFCSTLCKLSKLYWIDNYIFPQHHWETGAILRHQEISGRSEDPQPNSISASPAQAVTRQCGPYHTTAELLHQAEGQLQAGRVH